MAIYSDLSKDSPLAHIWLAANLDRKLSKQQYLSTNIVSSTHSIIENSSSLSSRFNLRISGQLLLGVVKIYSRKTKYLLDDVNDILLKLKTNLNKKNSVLLPIEKTLLPSIRNLILVDQVTDSHLLYQEPLSFDELITNSQLSQNTLNNSIDTSFDTSIELPRNAVDELDNNHVDFDLDFDLNLDDDMEPDRSVEVGRNVQNELPDLIDDDFDLGFDDPLIEAATPTDANTADITINDERPVRSTRERDPNRIIKRKLIFDSEIELNNDLIRSTFQVHTNLDVSINDKLNEYIRESILNLDYKRRKLDILPIPQQTEVDPQDQPEIDLDVHNISFPDFNQEFDFEPQLEEEPFPTSSQQSDSNSTLIIAQQLQKHTNTSFSTLLEQNYESNPLSKKPKAQACKVFFELLVLGNNSSISLDQKSLFGEIEITTNEKIFSF